MTPEELAALSVELKTQIDEQSAADGAEANDYRWHLGISIVDQECHRATWYDFRWFSPLTVSGRLTRLYARGHAEEPKITGLLERAGWTLNTRDPVTGKQFLYSAVNGHYGGSCDGIGYNIRYVDFSAGVLLEMKTHATKPFSIVVDKGVMDGKPQHYGQMCGYGYGFNLDYGLYFAVNKNDDDISPQFIKLNKDHGRMLELRAESIIRAASPPAKISTKATDFRCKMCKHIGVCHQGDKPVQHCRSCAHSQPTNGGEWWCAVYGLVIPRNVVRTGCGVHYKMMD